MLKLINVNKTYNRGKIDEIHVLKDINVEFPDCGMIALCGKSGSGKTTLLNAIGGLVKIDAGEIYYNDIRISGKDTAAISKWSGYVFQNFCLCAEKTVIENVIDALRLRGLVDREKNVSLAKKALEQVGMLQYANRYPHALSGGQQQRIAFARAIVHEPRVILADEPTGNLDDANKEIIMDLLKEYCKNHLVILVTHDMNIVSKYCDGFYGLVDGEISEMTNIQNSDMENESSDKELECDTDPKTKEYINNEVVVKHIGKIFDWKESIRKGISNSGKSRTGFKALRLCLFLLSVLVVFMTANIGVVVKDYINAGKRNNKNVYYGYIKNEEMAKKLEKAISSDNNFIDGIAYCEESFGGDSTFLLQIPECENSLVEDWKSNMVVFMHGALLPLHMLSNNMELKKYENLKDNEAVISSAMAYQVTKEGKLSFLSDADSLIGLRVNNDSDYTIVGIVESDEPVMYLSNESFSKLRLAQEYPMTEINRDEKIEKGKIKLRINSSYNEEEIPKIGSKVILNGLEFELESIVNTYYPYERWLVEKANKTLLTEEEYLAGRDNSVYEYWDYYFQYYGDYLAYCIQNRDSVYCDQLMELAYEGNAFANLYLKTMCCGLIEYYYAVRFYADNGVYPSEAELAYCYELYPDPGYELENTFGSAVVESGSDVEYVLSNEDYLACAASFGRTKGYGLWENDKPEGYVMLHATDTDYADKFVENFFSEYDRDGFSFMSATKADKAERKNIIRDNVFSLVIWGVIMLVMLFLTYLIMSSNLIRQKREFGIYRCLGVKKSNIAYHFCMENMVVVVLNSVLGITVISCLLLYIQKGRFAAAVRDVFYYPLYFGAAIILFFFIFGIIIGLFLITKFLKKEPGDIMSQLDL